MGTAPLSRQTLSPVPPVELPPLTAVTVPPPHRPIPTARRNWFRKVLIWSAFLTGLTGLSAWNATRSEALGEARISEERGDFVTALRQSLDHLDRRPWSREAGRLAARCLSRLDFPDKAEPFYRGAGGLTLDDLHYRAYGFVRANLREKAVQAYREILARHPDDVSALRAEGGVLLSQSRWDEAREVASRLARMPARPVQVASPAVIAGHWTLKPDLIASPPVLGYTLEGVVYHDLPDSHIQAVRAFERVLELDPGLRSMPLPRPLFWSHLCTDLFALGRSADVIRYLTKSQETRDDPGLSIQLGQAHVLQSSPDEAERCFRQALERDPDSFAAWLNLGRLELQRRRPNEAIAPLEQAARLRPGSYEVNYSLSLAYRQLRRGDEAKRYQEKADKLRTEPKRGGMGAPPSPTSS